MLRSIFGLDWKKSPAHLLFLSKFRKPRATADFSQSDTWKAVLKETPENSRKLIGAQGSSSELIGAHRIPASSHEIRRVPPEFLRVPKISHECPRVPTIARSPRPG